MVERSGRYLKEVNRYLKIFIGCLFGLLFFACTPKVDVSEAIMDDTQVPVAQPTETESVIAQPTEAEPTLETTLEPTTEATEEIVEETIAEEPQVNECIGYHSDKQRLIDTAKPEEGVESENEGEG
jgi:hypothetical protein